MFIGSAFSALWIIIANSWMQTPGGAELADEGTRAVLTNFFAAAFNPSTLTRYSHVICAVLIMGAFMTMAVAAWYMHKKDHEKFALRAMKIGSIVATISCACMLVTAHSSAVVVSEEQPTKFAMMEGMYEDEVPPLYAIGWVDEVNERVIAPSVSYTHLLMFVAGYLIAASADNAFSLLMLNIPLAFVQIFGLGKPLARYLERLRSHDWVLRLTSTLRLRLFLSLIHIWPSPIG